MRDGSVDDFLEVFLGFYLLVHDAVFYVAEVDYFGFYVLKGDALSFYRKNRPLNDVEIIGKVNLTFNDSLFVCKIRCPAFILNF